MNPSPAAADIARAFLPHRYHYWYARSKLASDPLYGGVRQALAGCRNPLLDLGCGIGLLAHAVPGLGSEIDYVGVDNDADKIASARSAAQRAGLLRARFEVVDLATQFPADHRGSVTILDMLQFLTPAARTALLTRVAACLAPDGRLVIRSGLADGNWRSRVTRGADHLACGLGWMNAAPRTYPTRAGLAAELAALGLDSDIRPLWGRTPFNNWLVRAWHPGHAPA